MWNELCQGLGDRFSMEIFYPDCSLYQGHWMQMSHNTGTSENKWLFSHADTVKMILVWHCLSLKLLSVWIGLEKKWGWNVTLCSQRKSQDSPSWIMYLTQQGKSSSPCVSDWFASSTISLMLSCAALRLIWPFNELVQTINLTRNNSFNFCFTWYLLHLFPRTRRRKTVGVHVRGWNSFASFSSKFFRSACKILSCFSKVL